MNNITNTKIEYFKNKQGKDQKTYRLDGHTNSHFVRIPKESYELLARELGGEDCHYVTPINDLIRSGYVPEHTSALVKSKAPDMYVEGRTILLPANRLIGELLGSRLCNLFGVDTVYNTLIDIDGECNMASIDYMERGDTFSDFEKSFEVPFMPPINENVLRLIRNNIYNRNTMNLSEHEKYNIWVGFLKQLIVRAYVLGDIDFCYYNCGVITNKKNKTHRLAPAFDLEWIINEFNWFNNESNRQEFMEMMEILMSVDENFASDMSRKFVEVSPKIYDTIRSIFNVDIEGESAMLAREKLLSWWNMSSENGENKNYTIEHMDEVIEDFADFMAKDLQEKITYFVEYYMKSKSQTPAD